eukprot:5716537-Amphidinium_carterae.2
MLIARSVIALIVRMPLSGIVPLKPFPAMENPFTARITWSQLSESAPSKLFVKMSNSVTALIVRTPLSGIVPLKRFPPILNDIMALITWSALSGSAPSKLFTVMKNTVTVLIVRMPLSGPRSSKIRGRQINLYSGD